MSLFWSLVIVISLKYLLDILRDLKRAELVRSKRGPDGGFVLSRPPARITLADVFRLFQTLSSEIRFLEADNPTGEFRVFLPRQREHEYRIDHLGDHFYIRTNLEAKNFRLMKTPVARTSTQYWQEVIGHRDDVFLQGFELFRDYLVVAERSSWYPGLSRSLQEREAYFRQGESARVEQQVAERLVDTGQGQLAARIAERVAQTTIFFPGGIAKLCRGLYLCDSVRQPLP